eukprot:TRINITY_DN25023_c0_g3_i1.p1 TRINITY_DN25023_c0_g3~~TRINITY_DN25023_c0_g3_i1.p1  ORF type:complete len:279 (-),score=-13.23 TRINITY_DN25023_c0_g3_i1:1294-2130(-)
MNSCSYLLQMYENVYTTEQVEKYDPEWSQKFFMQIFFQFFLLWKPVQMFLNKLTVFLQFQPFQCKGKKNIYLYMLKKSKPILFLFSSIQFNVTVPQNQIIFETDYMRSLFIYILVKFCVAKFFDDFVLGVCQWGIDVVQILSLIYSCSYQKILWCCFLKLDVSISNNYVTIYKCTILLDNKQISGYRFIQEMVGQRTIFSQIFVLNTYYMQKNFGFQYQIIQLQVVSNFEIRFVLILIPAVLSGNTTQNIPKFIVKFLFIIIFQMQYFCEKAIYLVFG